MRCDSSFSQTKNTTLVSSKLTQPNATTKPFYPDEPSNKVLQAQNFKRKPQKKSKSRKEGSTLYSHSTEQPSHVADSKSMSSLMQKIIAGNSAAKLKSSSKDPVAVNSVTQRSRNYKLKMGSGNSGINLVDQSCISATINNYNLGGANFGLGAITHFGNFAGGYVGAKGNFANNISAYATNASDLLRGFKSSQSIPIIGS